MARAYAKTRTSETRSWRVTPNTSWAIACFALLLTGYFYGIHQGKENGPLPHLRARSAPAQADNALPIAPGAGVSTSAGNLLARAQIENQLLYTDLQSFICSEQIQRYRGKLDGEKAQHVDTVTARVSFENGVENYTDILQNSRRRATLSSITGAWSEGEFGTLLRQTRALLGTEPVALQKSTDLNGTPAVVYSFDVSGKDSPWDLTVGSTQFRVPFRTNVWVSKDSSVILKIQRASTAMPPDSGISQIEWSVMLKPVAMDGKSWLLPSTGEYSVLYAATNRREWNTIEFSGYERYASRSVIHF